MYTIEKSEDNTVVLWDNDTGSILFQSNSYEPVLLSWLEKYSSIRTKFGYTNPYIITKARNLLWDYGFTINDDGFIEEFGKGSYQHQFMLVTKLIDAGFVYRMGENKEIIVEDWKEKK